MNSLTLSIWLRRYVLIGCALIVLILGWSAWGYHTTISEAAQGGWDTFRLLEFANGFLPHIVFISLLLIPWWRSGQIVRCIGTSLLLLFGAFITWGCIRMLQQGFFGFLPSLIFILTVFVAHATWLLHPRIKPLHRT